jgi:hypothetical protein
VLKIADDESLLLLDVMVHMWLKIEMVKESGKWEVDLLEHTSTDADLTWEDYLDPQ